MSKQVEKLVDQLHAYALGFPEAWEDDPWGEVVVKVRKKIFVFLGRRTERPQHVCFSVKLPESALDLLEDGIGEPTGYGLGKAGWVSFRFGPGDAPPIETMRAWIDESYRSVAPKLLSRQLDE